MELTFASYNIHKAVGLDRRRDPERILTILREMDADVVALQEADRRFGERASVLPIEIIERYTPYQVVRVSPRPQSLGWHGNALLVRQNINILHSAALTLPVLEPRGAISADLSVGGQSVRVLGMHLDLSGLRRRSQIRHILGHLADRDEALPTVMMGDFNEWAPTGGCFKEFDQQWQVLAPGQSFPTRRPVVGLDRIIACDNWRVMDLGVHKSVLSVHGSDHLPVRARLLLPKI